MQWTEVGKVEKDEEGDEKKRRRSLGERRAENSWAKDGGAWSKETVRGNKEIVIET